MSKKDEAILKDIVDGIQAASKEQTTPYDTTAEVTRVDGNTAYVHIPGGVDETPVTLTQNAKPGDNVQVRVSGGRAWIVGNATAPPTDDTTANIANTKATKAETKAVVAEVRAAEASDKAASANTKAEEAIEAVAPAIVTDTLHYLATDLGSGVTINTPGWTLTPQSMTSVNKYLWTYHTYHKASGQSTNTQPAITGVYGDSGSTGPQGPEGPRGATGADGDDGVSVASVQPQYYLSTSDQNPTGGNWSTTLMYETGKFIWTRDLITYSTGSTSYSQEICNYALSDTCLNAEDALMLAEGIDEHFWYDNTGAHVTEDTQQDYQQDPSSAGGNVLITSGGLAVREGMTELGTFTASGAQIGQSGAAHSVIDANGQRFYGTDGTTELANIGYGPTQGESGPTTAPYYTFGTRKANTAKGDKSTAEGFDSTASGYCSHAEGHGTTARGNISHAEGEFTIANGVNSHTEGHTTTASGRNSHAEGTYTIASGQNSHAEGTSTIASGQNSHAEGRDTIASSSNQTALGRWNIRDTADTYACIIGNGTGDSASERSNAFTVDWSGNTKVYGDLETVGGYKNFFKVVTVSKTISSLAAHTNNNIGTLTVPSASRPNGMTLVGVVGYNSTNYRVSEYKAQKNGDHSIVAGVTNTTATNISSSFTCTWYLLYINGTSA